MLVPETTTAAPVRPRGLRRSARGRPGRCLGAAPVRPRGLRTFLKDSLWSVGNRCSLQGLYTWDLSDGYAAVEQVTLPCAGLGAGWAGVRIAQLSDMHCSPIVRAGHLRRYVEIVNRFDVDFVVLTGDFITATAEKFARRVGEIVSELRPRVATLGCLGNHDYGVFHPVQEGRLDVAEQLTEQLEAGGVRVLINESHTYIREDSPLTFAGVADYWTDLYDPLKAFEAVAPDVPTIALSHNPDPAEDLAALGAGCVLSGHTHGKPTRPRSLTNLLFPVEMHHFYAGLYDLGMGRSLYVNRGIGGARSLAKDLAPEITLIELQPA